MAASFFCSPKSSLQILLESSDKLHLTQVYTPIAQKTGFKPQHEMKKQGLFVLIRIVSSVVIVPISMIGGVFYNLFNAIIKTSIGGINCLRKSQSFFKYDTTNWTSDVKSHLSYTIKDILLCITSPILILGYAFIPRALKKVDEKINNN